MISNASAIRGPLNTQARGRAWRKEPEEKRRPPYISIAAVDRGTQKYVTANTRRAPFSLFIFLRHLSTLPTPNLFRHFATASIVHIPPSPLHGPPAWMQGTYKDVPLPARIRVACRRHTLAIILLWNVAKGTQRTESGKTMHRKNTDRSFRLHFGSSITRTVHDEIPKEFPRGIGPELVLGIPFFCTPFALRHTETGDVRSARPD